MYSQPTEETVSPYLVKRAAIVRSALFKAQLYPTHGRLAEDCTQNPKIENARGWLRWKAETLKPEDVMAMAMAARLLDATPVPKDYLQRVIKATVAERKADDAKRKAIEAKAKAATKKAAKRKGKK